LLTTNRNGANFEGEIGMRRLLTKFITCCSVLAIAGALSVAQDFKQYPGSKLDEDASRQASAVTKGVECQVYTTGDSFEKLHGFYKGLYREFTPRFPKPTLPKGQEIQWAFFILDVGKDLVHSKYWMKIQRPYIGTISNDDGEDFKDVRDISVIQTVRRK
jgi:hypothetical protein